MIDTAAELPNDVETLKVMLLAARAETATLTAEASALTAEAATLRAAKAAAETRIERLHALLKTLERARYGRRSEMLDPDQHEFAFEEIQTGLGAIEATLDAVAKTPQPRALTAAQETAGSSRADRSGRRTRGDLRRLRLR